MQETNKIINEYYESVSSEKTLEAIQYIVNKFKEFNFKLGVRKKIRDIQFHEKNSTNISHHPFALIINKTKGSLFYFRNKSIQKYNIDIDNLKTNAKKINLNNKNEYNMRISNIEDAKLLINYIFKLNTIIYPDEIEDIYNLLEGATKQITVNAYERNLKARRECIEYYGTICTICNFNFEEIYGEIGRDFIHVHHIKPLSEINEQYKINSIEDLRPICPNCHAMLHKRKPAYSIEEIKNLIDKNAL